jgi:hypothetical protein
MNASELVAAIDSEINLLKQVRSLLAGMETHNGAKRSSRQSRRGGKRTLSAEARARISAAQKKRWAQQKKSAQRY